MYRALGDPTRRGILRTLARGDRTISELARPHDMTLAAVSKHVGVLEGAGLVARTRIGRTWSIRLCTAPLRRAARWLGFYESYGAEPLERLEELLAAPSARRDGGAGRSTRHNER